MENNNQSRVLSYCMAQNIPDEELGNISGGSSALLSRHISFKPSVQGQISALDVVLD